MARRSTISAIRIDRAGRVVIPNALRQRLHLHPGSRMTASVEADQLVLRPLEERDGLLEEDGILVATGSLVGHLADHRSVRAERNRKLGGS